MLGRFAVGSEESHDAARVARIVGEVHPVHHLKAFGQLGQRLFVGGTGD